ncbi:kinase-like protein [Rickenella mellea]|uniref:Kinase-like protein n=1 Tax=Rickenella mellea TaxID=50990 RepID=A0A4Y7QDM4_9AGAM|nr:kinase-like protein [Rickenella mellea]
MAYLPRKRLSSTTRQDKYFCIVSPPSEHHWPIYINWPDQEFLGDLTSAAHLRSPKDLQCYVARNADELETILKDIVQELEQWTDETPREDKRTVKFMETFMESLRLHAFPTRETKPGDEALICQEYLLKLFRKLGYYTSKPFLDHEISLPSKNYCARGGFADIHKGVWLGGRSVAIKVLRFEKHTADVIRKYFDRELRVWRLLQHPNVLPLCGTYTGFGKEKLCFVSPWQVNGNIREYLGKNSHFDRLNFMYEAALGLQYLHDRIPQVIHGDLRGTNIFVSETEHALIADFGLSILTEQPGFTSDSWGNGSLRWMAAELLSEEIAEDTRRTTASDIYAYACTVLEVLTDNHPFAEVVRDVQIVHHVVNMKKTPQRPPDDSPAVSRGLSDDLWQLLRKCWLRDRQKRPRIDFVVDSTALYSRRVPSKVEIL